MLRIVSWKPILKSKYDSASIYPPRYPRGSYRCEVIMVEMCPHCGGRLIEKHEETEVVAGKTIVSIFFRCVSCGKWTKKEKKPH